ncbi:MAG: hypothetical protein Q7S02_02625, partial [bacterium]|nr:hypothetical protein [bacterium]
IPAHQMTQIITFFRRVARLHAAEALILLYYREAERRYELLCPEQVVTGGSIKYDGLDDPPGLRLVGSVHSHVYMAAFHSGTDEADEATFDGLHITVGKLNQPAVDVVASIKVGAARFRVSPEDVCEGMRPVWDTLDTVPVSRALIAKASSGWDLKNGGKDFNTFLTDAHALGTLKQWIGAFLTTRKSGTTITKTRTLEGYVVDLPPGVSADDALPDPEWLESVAPDGAVTRYEFTTFLRDMIRAIVLGMDGDDTKYQKFDRAVAGDESMRQLVALHDAIAVTSARSDLYAVSTTDTSVTVKRRHAKRGKGAQHTPPKWVTHEDAPLADDVLSGEEDDPSFAEGEFVPCESSEGNEAANDGMSDEGGVSPPQQPPTEVGAARKSPVGMRVRYSGPLKFLNERFVDGEALARIHATITGFVEEGLWMCWFDTPIPPGVGYTNEENRRHLVLPGIYLEDATTGEPIVTDEELVKAPVHDDGLVHDDSPPWVNADAPIETHEVSTDGLGSLQPAGYGDEPF